jgi:hypothetical protein
MEPAGVAEAAGEDRAEEAGAGMADTQAKRKPGMHWAPEGQQTEELIAEDPSAIQAKKPRSSGDKLQPTAEQMVRELQQMQQQKAALKEVSESTRPAGEGGASSSAEASQPTR